LESQAIFLYSNTSIFLGLSILNNVHRLIYQNILHQTENISLLTCFIQRKEETVGKCKAIQETDVGVS